MFTWTVWACSLLRFSVWVAVASVVASMVVLGGDVYTSSKAACFFRIYVMQERLKLKVVEVSLPVIVEITFAILARGTYWRVDLSSDFVISVKWSRQQSLYVQRFFPL